MGSLEERYWEARKAFQAAYKRFEWEEDGVIKRRVVNPQMTTLIQQAWNVYLPLRKKFKGF